MSAQVHYGSARVGFPSGGLVLTTHSSAIHSVCQALHLAKKQTQTNKQTSKQTELLLILMFNVKFFQNIAKAILAVKNDNSGIFDILT